MTDKMSSKERLAAIRDGRQPDRLPIRLMFNSAAGVLCNMSFKEAFSSAVNYASCQIAAYRRYGCDGVNASYSMHGIGMALGAEIVRPENGNFFISKYPIQSIGELSVLNLDKVKLENDALAWQAMEVIDILKKELGDEVGIGISFPGPATGVVSLIGMENFLKWMVKYPDVMNELLQFTTDAVKIISKPFLEKEVGIGLSDPAASGMILGAKRYQDYIFPYTKKIFEWWKAQGQKARGYHVCGNTTKILESMAQTGSTSLSIDNMVSLKTAKEKVGYLLPISGNIDPVQVIKDGTEQQMTIAIKKAYEDAGDSPKGFTLSPGCGIPVNTSREQMDLFVKTAKKYAEIYK